MERHNQNAFAVANMLMQHPKIEAVYYPGLPTHQQHELAKRQMKRGFGGMVAFDVGSREAAKKLMNNLKLCTLATSLGGVETLIQHPASMTNASTPREERLQAGITDGLIRLSVGIENADDLIADFEQALREI
jgi:methionine-gamma-lyase